MEKIKFAFADGEEAAEFFVLEQTRIAGVDYILVTDSEADSGRDSRQFPMHRILYQQLFYAEC